MGGDVLRALLGGADLRDSGSGNVGATNALRTRGACFAAGVLAIDVSKGALAVVLIPRLPWLWPSYGILSQDAVACACGAAVAMGQCFPIFHYSRGGKGVATLTGIFTVLLPLAMPWMFSGFVLTLVLTGYVSLASLTGAAIAVVWSALQLQGGLGSPQGELALWMTVLLAYKHRRNIGRLLSGKEPRFERVRFLGRVLDRWLDR